MVYKVQFQQYPTYHSWLFGTTMNWLMQLNLLS